MRDGVDRSAPHSVAGRSSARSVARIVRLRPIDALASQTGSTAVLLGATLTGAPVSTTQVVASSVVGVGVGKHRMRHVRWAVVRSMLIAWLLTVPATAVIAIVALFPWRWLT